MRLFGKVDGSIDRQDRAAWLTCPFDLAYQSSATSRTYPTHFQSTAQSSPAKVDPGFTTTADR